MIGTLVRLKVSILNNPVGALGVCYHVYEDLVDENNNEPIAGFIFENGNHDGFSKKEREDMLEHLGKAEWVYEFTNVMKLTEDFQNGWCDLPLAKAKHKAAFIDAVKSEATDQHNDGWVRQGAQKRLERLTSWDNDD